MLVSLDRRWMADSEASFNKHGIAINKIGEKLEFVKNGNLNDKQTITIKKLKVFLNTSSDLMIYLNNIKV